MDSRNFAQSQGVPYVFDHYQAAGHADATGDKVVFAERPLPRAGELPLTLTVVDFPEVGARRP